MKNMILLLSMLFSGALVAQSPIVNATIDSAGDLWFTHENGARTGVRLPVTRIDRVGDSTLLSHPDGGTTLVPPGGWHAEWNASSGSVEAVLDAVGPHEFESEYVDDRGVTHRIRTDCPSGRSAESCARDHAARVRVLMELFPPRQVPTPSGS